MFVDVDIKKLMLKLLENYVILIDTQQFMTLLPFQN